MPTISFTEKFIDSVSFSSRDVSSKSWESIGDFGDYESVEDKVQCSVPVLLCAKLLNRFTAGGGSKKPRMIGLT